MKIKIKLLLLLSICFLLLQSQADPVRKLLNTSERVIDSLNDHNICYEYDVTNETIREVRIYHNGSITIKYGEYDIPYYLGWVNPPFNISNFESTFILDSKWYIGPWSYNYSFRKGGNFIELQND